MYTFVDFTSEIAGWRGFPGLAVTLKIDYYYYYNNNQHISITFNYMIVLIIIHIQNCITMKH
jgi:hypothetical protein